MMLRPDYKILTLVLVLMWCPLALAQPAPAAPAPATIEPEEVDEYEEEEADDVEEEEADEYEEEEADDAEEDEVDEYEEESEEAEPAPAEPAAPVTPAVAPVPTPEPAAPLPAVLDVDEADDPEEEEADDAEEESGEQAEPTDDPGVASEDAEAEAEATDDKDEEPEFVEGELASIGALGFLPWKNRVGAIIGIEQIGETAYLGIRPHVNYTTELWDQPLSVSFGIPLRIELVDSRGHIRFQNAGKFKATDWDEVSDYFQIINNITFGGKEKRVYLDINAFRATSIGHGTIVKRYNPNMNFNTRRIQAEFDGFTDYFGGELYVDNVTGPNVTGGLVFFKPLSLIDRDNYAMRSFSIGGQFFADINAPLRNILDDDDLDGDGRRWTEIEVDQETFQPNHVKSMVIAYGVSTEVKIWDERALDWKTYVDYSFLETGVPTDSDPSVQEPNYVNIPTRHIRSGGFTWGNLFRMNFGRELVHALRLRLEFRNYDPHYIPSYFDTLYDVQRVQFPMTSPDLVNQTKLQQVLGRPSDGARVNGGYAELSYRVGNYFAMALGVEVSDTAPDNSLFVHLEVPKLGPWNFVATYQRRNAETIGSLFDLELKPTDFLLMQTRFNIVDIFHVAVEVMTPFGIGPESLFQNVFQVNFNMELGFKYL